MASSGGEQISLQVRTLATGNHNVQVPAQASVADLKQVLVRPTGLPVARQRIIYSGRVLEDGQFLSAAGIRDGHTLHLVEQDPSTQPQQQQQQQHGARVDPAAFMQAMLGGMASPGGVPQMPGVSAQVLGPFDVTDAGAWQQVQQQMSATLGGLMRAASGAHGGAPGDGAGAGSAAAAGGTASPFNFGNLFAQPLGGGGQGTRAGGRGGGDAGAGAAAAGQPDMAGWWDALQQHMPQEDDRAHLFDGLDVLLAGMEDGSAAGGTEDLPHINQITEDLEGVPPQHRPTWRRNLASWQRNFLSAARSVLETAQLSSATRAAVNRVLEAAGAAPLRLSAAGGSRPAERRVRSFPVLFDAAAQGDGAAAAVEGDAWAGVQGGPPSLVSGGGSDSGWEEMGEEEVAAQAAAEAAARERRLREAQDGAVEDCRLSEGEEDSDEGPPPLRSDPGSEESEGEQPPARRRPAAAAAPRAPPPLLPLGDMLLLGGVAAGELARRFLLALGAPAAPGAAGAGARGQAAAVAEAVERLRGLTEVPTAEGAAREAVVADLRLLGVHMSRVSAAAGELMRAMQYLGSGAEHRNLFLTRAQPGYLRINGDRATTALPRPQRLQLVPAMVDISMAPGPAVPGSGGPGLQHMLGSMLGPVVAQLQVAAAAHGAGRGAGRGPGRGAAAGRGAAGERRGQPEEGEQVVRVRLLDGAGQPVPAAIPVGGAAGQAAEAAGGEMSDEVAGMAAMLLGQLGVDPAGQQQLLGQFGGIMRALRETSVTSLDIPAIGREVGAAVRQAVARQSQPLQTALQAAAAPAGSQAAAAPGTAAAAVQQQAAEFARAVVPAVTSEVQRVLQQHLARMRSSPAVAAFAPHLEELGIDLMAEPAAAPEAPAGEARPAEGHQPEQSVATAPPAASDAAAVAAAEPGVEAPPPAGAPAPAAVQHSQAQAEAAEPAAAEAAAAASVAGPSAPALPAPEPPAASAASTAGPDSSTAAGGAGCSTAGGGSSAGAPSGLGRGFLLPRKPARPAKKPAAANPHPTAEPQQPLAEAPAAAAAPTTAPAPASPATSRSAAPPASTPASAPADLALARRGGDGGGGSLDLAALMGGLGGSGAGGGGGGLMGMLQGMMSNPALMEMAQSPAMQRMAEQMFSGGGAGGGGAGGGLAGLMNAMGPLMGEVLGGGGPAPPAPGIPGVRSARTQASASLDDVLSAALSPEEAQHWKEAIEADSERQQMQGEPRQPFSDAYLAALPPKTASSLLRLEDDSGDGEEGEEQVHQQ